MDEATGSPGRFATAAAAYFRPIGLRLWDCKAAVLSVAIGFAVITLRTETRDLFLDSIGLFVALKFAALIFLVWAVQLYHSAAASIALVQRPPNSMLGSVVDRTLPAILGLLPFAIMLVGIYLARKGLLACEKLSVLSTLKECLGGYVNTNTHLQFDTLLSAGDITQAYSVPEVDDALGSLRNLSIAVVASAVAFLAYLLLRHRIVSSRLIARVVAYLPATNLALMACLFLWVFYWPISLSAWAGRLLLLPFLLGAWLPIANLSTRTSRRVRWPVATTVVVLALFASTYVDRFNDVRVYQSARWRPAQQVGDNQPDAGLQRQTHLDDAIDRWMRANSCTADRPETCPRIVLVAAEGGASRAAFFTSTVVGALLDATRGTPGRYVDFGNALFAISGVSGGSVGATTIRTALSESSEGKPPCIRSDSSWFGSTGRYSGDPRRDPLKSWRSCLQLLSSGDYLSPVIVGLSLRDTFPILSQSDRAVLLERAIERHYNHIVHGKRSWCGDKDDRGLCAPFGYLTQAPKPWLPLLLLNATSMDNGRPILMSDIHTPVRNVKCDSLFVVAQNAFELYATYPFYPSEPVADVMPSCVYSGLEQALDVRLSTAAVVSARFPVISPAGWIRFENQDKKVYTSRDNVVTSRAVDGGYFDNSGLETISALLPVLEARGLKPLVLHLVNEPWFYKANKRAGRPYSGQGAILANRILPTELEPPVQGFWSKLFALVAEPLGTILELRAGHREAALERILQRWPNQVISIEIKRYIFNRDYPESPRNMAAEFCVNRPPVRRLNDIALYQPVMSWWLSFSSQRAIDAQLCDQENISDLSRVLRELERKGG